MKKKMASFSTITANSEGFLFFQLESISNITCNRRQKKTFTLDNQVVVYDNGFSEIVNNIRIHAFYSDFLFHKLKSIAKSEESLYFAFDGLAFEVGILSVTKSERVIEIEILTSRALHE